MKDPYLVLGVSRSASTEEIKAAYRRRAKQTHPDLNNGSTASSREFQEVTEAYAILVDPAERSRFDRLGKADAEKVSSQMSKVYDTIALVRERARQAKQEAKEYAFEGLAWLGGGLALTSFFYYVAASAGGGKFLVFYGLIFVGGYKAIVGFANYLSVGAKAREIERNVWKIVTG